MVSAFSIMFTLNFIRRGACQASSRIWRICSIFVFCPSGDHNIMSGEWPWSMLRQEAHSSQLPPSTGFSQLRALANSMAVRVFPTPRGPKNG